jgi:23S rRNA (pseudouridine1915-N3)-methyltransferase
MIGKTNIDFVAQGIKEYENRLKHYIKFEQKIIQTPKHYKNLTKNELQKRESDLIQETLNNNQTIYLLDENGKEYSSTEFATIIQKNMNKAKDITFVIGGAFGFDNNLKKKYPKISLSKMTFSHQMIRLIFIEQLYRAFTIIRGENYHH